MSFREWRQTFLVARGLTRPNGQMLFAYRTTASEYFELRQLFGQKLAGLQGREWYFSSVDECALFVLYAAEWWRRDYGGGPWRWMHILESLHDGKIQLPIAERNDAVERGMLSWGHRVGDEGKKFLGAIVAHGGLPLQMVARGDGAVTKLLYRATQSAQMFLWDEWRLMEFFKEQDVSLVSHLREPAIHRLLASIVMQVLVLKREHRLGGLEHPVDRLNAVAPSWRDQFPIQVDDAAVESLLVGLVKEAAQEREVRFEQPIVADRLLQLKANDTYNLVTAFRAPVSLSAQSLAMAVGLPEAQLPSGFAFLLRSVECQQALEARELMSSGGQRYALSGRLKSVSGDQALAEFSYDMVARGEVIRSQLVIQGAEALDELSPWVFCERTQQLSLVAVGCADLPDSQAWVSVPEDATCSPSDGTSTVERVGQIALTRPRQVLRITGSLNVEIDGVEFQVACGVSSTPLPKLAWRGRRISYDSHPFPVYLGAPELCMLGEDGRLHALPSQQVEWVSPGSRESIPNIRSFTGVADAWLIKAGRKTRRYRLAIIRPNATIEFESGLTESDGVITLQGWGVRAVHVKEATGMAVDVDHASSRLKLRCSGEPPACVYVSVDWGRASPKTELTLPYPATGGRFLSSDGVTLTGDAFLSTRALEQVRIRVFDRNPSLPKSYRLHAELMRGRVAKEATRRPVSLEYPVATDASGMGELRLMEIATQLRGVISQSDDLDAKIHLTLRASGQVLRSIYITRYDADLERSGVDISLNSRSLQQFSVAQLEGLQLLAQPIVAPADEPRSLTQSRSSDVPTGRWSLVHLSAAEGPWLVYPAKGSRLQVRPIVFPGFSVGKPTPVARKLCPLGAAMMMGDLTARWHCLNGVINDMSSNWRHSSWDHLKALHSRFRHLPLGTFDHWKILACNWHGLLACLARLESDLAAQCELANRISEELGVMWELMPKAKAVGSISKSRDEFSGLLGGDSKAVIDLLVTDRCKRWVTAIPAARSLIGYAAFACSITDEELQEDGLSLARFAARPVRAVLDEFWSQEDCELQRHLLRPFAEDARWPDLGLHNDLLEVFEQQVPEHVQQWIGQKIGRQLLWSPPDRRDHRIDVACSPFIAALLLQLVPDAWLNFDKAAQAKLRHVRSFAPDWFARSAHRALVVSCQAPE